MGEPWKESGPLVAIGRDVQQMSASDVRAPQRAQGRTWSLLCAQTLSRRQADTIAFSNPPEPFLVKIGLARSLVNRIRSAPVKCKAKLSIIVACVIGDPVKGEPVF